MFKDKLTGDNWNEIKAIIKQNGYKSYPSKLMLLSGNKYYDSAVIRQEQIK